MLHHRRRLSPFQRINHFPASAEICRKDFLAFHLNAARRALPGAYAFAPESWVLPGALEAFTRRHSARLTKLCGMGPHHGVLPEEVRELALRAATGLAQVSEYASTCKLHSSEVDPERAELLRDL